MKETDRLMLRAHGVGFDEIDRIERETAARIAELEAALDGVIDYAQESLDDCILKWGNYRKDRIKIMETNIQRARDALAKETT